MSLAGMSVQEIGFFIDPERTWLVLGKENKGNAGNKIKICEALNCNINEIIETVPVPNEDDKESTMEQAQLGGKSCHKKRIRH